MSPQGWPFEFEASVHAGMHFMAANFSVQFTI
jgi:hypothetical protein